MVSHGAYGLLDVIGPGYELYESMIGVGVVFSLPLVLVTLFLLARKDRGKKKKDDGTEQAGNGQDDKEE